MGCGASAAPKPQPQPQPVVQPPPAAVPQQPQPQRVEGNFQIKLEGKWQDYGKVEDYILKRAYSIGYPHAQYELRKQEYEYDFKNMKQRNVRSNKLRDIRPPRGMTAPASPLLPAGPMVMYTVKPGDPGQTVSVKVPNGGGFIQVNVPADARPGQQMAVPVPKPGESVEDVVEKQKKQQGHSTGAKVGMGLAGVTAAGALAVGGVILGDHLMGGSVGADAAGAVSGVVAGADWAGAVDGVSGAAADASGAITGVAADGVDAIGGAVGEVDIGGFAGDAGGFLGDAAGEAGGWFEQVGSDASDFIMNLF